MPRVREVHPDVVLVIESGAGSREGRVDLEAAAHGHEKLSQGLVEGLLRDLCQ